MFFPLLIPPSPPALASPGLRSTCYATQQHRNLLLIPPYGGDKAKIASYGGIRRRGYEIGGAAKGGIRGIREKEEIEGPSSFFLGPSPDA